MASTTPPLLHGVCLPRNRRERTKSCSWSRAGSWRGNSRYRATTQPALRSAALEAALRSRQQEPFPVEAAVTASQWERLFHVPARHHREEAEFGSIASFAGGIYTACRVHSGCFCIPQPPVTFPPRPSRPVRRWPRGQAAADAPNATAQCHGAGSGDGKRCCGAWQPPAKHARTHSSAAQASGKLLVQLGNTGVFCTLRVLLTPPAPTSSRGLRGCPHSQGIALTWSLSLGSALTPSCAPHCPTFAPLLPMSWCPKHLGSLRRAGRVLQNTAPPCTGVR